MNPAPPLARDGVKWRGGVKYYKKPKYKIDPKKLRPKKEEDLTLEEFYKEQLRKKSKYRR